MTTVSDLIEETRRQLQGSTRVILNRLASAVTSSATSLTLEFTINFGAGAYLALGDEIVYVWSVDTTTKAVTVQRGQLGSKSSAHSAGDIVEVNPEFPKVRIRQALRDEIKSWPNDLFQVDSVSVDATAGYYAQGLNIPVTDDWHYILDVRHSSSGGRSGSYKDAWPQVKFEVVRDADTSDFANGAAIILQEPVPTGSLRVTYARPFDCSTFDDSTVLETTVGLSSTMLDIPPVGAAWRLELPREVKRTQTYAQGESRMAEEVEAGAILRAGQFLKAIRDQRISEEAARLRAKYPVRHE